MQTLPITWAFPETVVGGGRAENFDGAVNIVADIVGQLSAHIGTVAQVELADATQHPLPQEVCDVWFTDPPYYDAIPYSDLSDFFLVWWKRIMPNSVLLMDPFDSTNLLSPKAREAVQDDRRAVNGHVKDRQYFEDVMAKAFSQGRMLLHDHGVGSVVFAHKTTQGWEALVSGIIRGGWTVTASWPIATENPGRLRARESAALATSVHLVCRPRSDDAGVGDWGEVLQELPGRAREWIQRLQTEGVRGADLVFACVGPALEVYSRYSSVETAEGNKVELAAYLEKVWAVVGYNALSDVLGVTDEMAGGSNLGDMEEDARLTALFLWTYQSSDKPEGSGGGKPKEEEDEPAAPVKGLSLPFDMVRRFTQPMGIDLDRWTGRVVGQKKGVVRLLPVLERAGELFGEAGAGTVAEAVETDPIAGLQMSLFPDQETRPRPSPGTRSRLDIEDAQYREGAGTVLDRVHTAMLFQHGGHTSALRALIKTQQERGPEFMRLANALSALYPRGSRDKRLLDAMLLAAPR